MAVEVLLQQGWSLSEGGLNKCTEDGTAPDKVIQKALNSDLREIGAKVLPEDICKGKIDFIEGPCILQIQKIRNVSAPKDHEENQGAPRLLRLTLTDGHTGCNAIELESLDSISLNTLPGTKIKVVSTVVIEHNFLLMNNKNCRWLGGRVDKLAESWELKRSLSNPQRNRVGGKGSAPPFVPFGQASKVDKVTNDKKDNFKSLGKEDTKKAASVGEFEQQRQATIAEVLQTKGDGAGKVFGGGKNQFSQDRNLAKIVDMGFSPEDALASLKICNNDVEEAVNSLINRAAFPPPGGNKALIDTATAKPPPRRRGVWDRDASPDDGAVKNRPSTTATLFDFLDKSTKEDFSQPSPKEPEPVREPTPPPPDPPTPSPPPPPLLPSPKEKHESEPPVHDPPSHDYNHSSRRYDTYSRKPNLPPRLANRLINGNNQSQYRGGDSARRNTNRNYNNNSNSDRAYSDSGYRGDTGNVSPRGNYSHGNTSSYGNRGRRDFGDNYGNRGDYGYNNRGYGNDHAGNYGNSNYGGSSYVLNNNSRGRDYGNGSYRDNWNSGNQGNRDWNSASSYGNNSAGGRDYNSHEFNSRGYNCRDYSPREYNSSREFNNSGREYSNGWEYSNSQDHSNGVDYSNSREYKDTQHDTRSVKFSNSAMTHKSGNPSGSKTARKYPPMAATCDGQQAYGHNSAASSHSNRHINDIGNYDCSLPGENIQLVGDMQINLDENEMLFAPNLAVSSAGPEASFRDSDEWPQNGSDTVQYYFPGATADGLYNPAPIAAASNCEMIYNDPAVVMAGHQHSTVMAGHQHSTTMNAVTPTFYGQAPMLAAPPHNSGMQYGVGMGAAPHTQPLSINSNYPTPSYPVYPGEDWLFDMNQYSHPQYASPSTDSTVDSSEPYTQELKRLDKCMARFSIDGVFYEAVIEAISPNMPVCLVTFTDYGNSEEVSISDIRPYPKNTPGGEGLRATAHAFIPDHVTAATTSLPYSPPVPLEQNPFAPYHVSEYKKNKKGDKGSRVSPSSTTYNNNPRPHKK